MEGNGMKRPCDGDVFFPAVKTVRYTKNKQVGNLGIGHTIFNLIS